MQGYYKSQANNKVRLGELTAGEATKELQELVKLDYKQGQKLKEFSCDNCFVKLDLNESEYHDCILTRRPYDFTANKGKKGPKQLNNDNRSKIFTCECKNEYSSSAYLKSHIIFSADKAHGSIPCLWKNCTHWFATYQERDGHLE